MTKKTKFCPNCGSEIIEGAAFCPACGFALHPTNNNVKKRKIKLSVIVIVSLTMLLFVIGSFLLGYSSNTSNIEQSKSKITAKNTDRTKPTSNSKVTSASTKKSTAAVSRFTEKQAAAQLKKAGTDPDTQGLKPQHDPDGSWEFLDDNGMSWIAYPDGLNNFPGDSHYY